MNGFDPDWVEVERVCLVPKAVEQKYFHGPEKMHAWPWYVYGREFFEGVGADFREIDGRLQMLLEDIVYSVDEFSPCSMLREYSVGPRAARNLEEIPEFREIERNYQDTDYFGSIAPFVHEMLGRCLMRCQEIEHNLASSFIFCAPHKNKPEGKTINDLRAEWRKLTIGQLLAMIKRDWEMLPEVEAALNLFKDSRNLFIHRLSTDPRYDISTKWGVMEFLPFLQFFDLQTKIVMRASQSSAAASLLYALKTFGTPDGLNAEDMSEELDERAAEFFAMFWMRGEPWPSQSSSGPESELT